jgi:hypothetical protein
VEDIAGFTIGFRVNGQMPRFFGKGTPYKTQQKQSILPRFVSVQIKRHQAIRVVLPILTAPGVGVVKQHAEHPEKPQRLYTDGDHLSTTIPKP